MLVEHALSRLSCLNRFLRFAGAGGIKPSAHPRSGHIAGEHRRNARAHPLACPAMPWSSDHPNDVYLLADSPPFCTFVADGLTGFVPAAAG